MVASRHSPAASRGLPRRSSAPRPASTHLGVSRSTRRHPLRRGHRQPRDASGHPRRCRRDAGRRRHRRRLPTAPPARFNGPVGVAVDGRGRVHCRGHLQRPHPRDRYDGTVTTLAGGAGAGRQTTAARPRRASTRRADGRRRRRHIYVADTGNGAIRRIDPRRCVTTIAKISMAEARRLRPIGGRQSAITARRTSGMSAAVSSSSRRAGRTDHRGGRVVGFRDGPARGAFPPAGRDLAAAGRRPSRCRGRRQRPHARDDAVAPSVAELPPSPWPPSVRREAFARTPLLWPISPMDGPHEVAGTSARRAAPKVRALPCRRRRTNPAGHAGPRGARRNSRVPVSTGDFGSLNEWLRLVVGELRPRPCGTKTARAMSEHAGGSSEPTTAPEARAASACGAEHTMPPASSSRA